MTSAATYTSPFTLAEFQSAIDLSAHGAGLGRRCPTVNLYDVHTVPLTFVRQLTDKLSERRVADRLSQVMIAPHAAHVQVLDEYRTHLAIVREFIRDLVQKVMTLVPDLRMTLGNYMLLSGPIVRAGLLSGKDALLAAKTPLGVLQRLRIDIAPAVGADDIIAVQINADAGALMHCHIRRCFLHDGVNKDRGVVPVSGLLANGNVLDRTVKRTVQHSLNTLALGDRNGSVLPIDRTMLGVVERLSGVLALRDRMRRLVLPPVPESIRTLLDGILQRLRVNLTNP